VDNNYPERFHWGTLDPVYEIDGLGSNAVAHCQSRALKSSLAVPTPVLVFVGYLTASPPPENLLEKI